MVANLEKNQRDDNYDDDSPEAEKLSRQEICVLVGKHDEVVALDIQEGQDEESPTIFDNHLSPFLEAILVQGEGRVYYVEQDIIEEGLEGRDTRASSINQGCESVCSSLSQSNDLGEQEHDPEISCPQVCEAWLLCAFSFFVFVYKSSIIYNFGGAMDSAVDARAGCRRLGGCVGSFGLDSDSLDDRLDLDDVAGLVGFVLLLDLVAHADSSAQSPDLVRMRRAEQAPENNTPV